MASEYWSIVVVEALDEVGLTYTPEQAQELTKILEGSASVEGEMCCASRQADFLDYKALYLKEKARADDLEERRGIVERTLSSKLGIDPGTIHVQNGRMDARYL